MGSLMIFGTIFRAMRNVCRHISGWANGFPLISVTSGRSSSGQRGLGIMMPRGSAAISLWREKYLNRCEWPGSVPGSTARLRGSHES
jgi:hypothetical protein